MPNKFHKFAGAVGIISPLFFTASVTVLTLAQYNFMRSLGWDPLYAPTFDWPSGLSLGAYGWLMTLTFIISGALMAVFALGLHSSLQTRSGKSGSFLLMFAGFAVIGLAFTTDPTLRSTPATWHGRLHDLSFVLLGLALIPAMIVLGIAFQKQIRWKTFSAYTWMTAALALLTFILKGIAFYIFLLAMLAWNEVIAYHLWKTGDRSEHLTLIETRDMALDKSIEFINEFADWAHTKPDISAIALVGSHARNTATETSDIDLVMITSLPDNYLKDLSWILGFGRIERYQIEDYGRLTSVRVFYKDGPEVEYGITDKSWATLPLDEGTREVISGGMRILFDKENILSRHQTNI